MTLLNGIALQTGQPVATPDTKGEETMGNRTFATSLGVFTLIALATVLVMWLIINNARIADNHAGVKYYVRTSVLMLNDNLNRGDPITYFAGTDTFHGDHTTLHTRTTIDPIDPTHYTISTTSLNDGYTVSYDSWHADYVTHN